MFERCIPNPWRNTAESFDLNDIDKIIVRRRYHTTSHQPQVSKIDIDDEF